MYPTLYHALLDLTGLSVPLLKFFNSFGFFVALAFVFASWTLGLELRRKERQGLLKPVKRTVVEGAKAGPMDYLLNGVIGFVIGWKLLHLVMDTSVLDDPQAFLLSGTGSIVGGLVGAAAMLAWRWNDSRKQHLEKPRKKEVQMLPHEHAGNITLTAAIWGIIGAKLFHWLENPGEFMAFLQAPSTSTLFSGLTMYGGLILAGAMVIRYFVRHGIPAFEGADSAAPGVMLAYGIGRIGCQVSGDGDWGIVNTAAAPSFIPRWLWAYDYPNNVNGVGIPLTDGRPCFEGYCTVLPETVFPTPLYETIVCVAFFFLLWSLRSRLRPAGMIFFLFLFLNGLERFFVEKIRVNVRVLGDITQAEIIATVLMVAGVAGMIWLRTRKTHPSHGSETAH
jgi:phosphatidylglycerol---prolipoprotein diacylglyceryl transferase